MVFNSLMLIALERKMKNFSYTQFLAETIVYPVDFRKITMFFKKQAFKTNTPSASELFISVVAY